MITKDNVERALELQGKECHENPVPPDDFFELLSAIEHSEKGYVIGKILGEILLHSRSLIRTASFLCAICFRVANRIEAEQRSAVSAANDSLGETLIN